MPTPNLNRWRCRPLPRRHQRQLRLKLLRQRQPQRCGRTFAVPMRPTDPLRRTRRIVCLHTAALWAHLSLGGSDPIESASACTCGRSGRRSGSGEEYCDYRAVLRSTLRISPSKGCRSTPSARALHTALSHCTAACARPQLYDVGATARPMRVRARTHTSVRTQAQHVQACSAPAVRRRALSALVGRQPLSARSPILSWQLPAEDDDPEKARLRQRMAKLSGMGGGMMATLSSPDVSASGPRTPVENYKPLDRVDEASLARIPLHCPPVRCTQ